MIIARILTLLIFIKRACGWLLVAWSVMAFANALIHVVSLQHWPIGPKLTVNRHQFDCTTPHGFLIQMVLIWLIFGIGRSMSRPWETTPQPPAPSA